MYAPDGNWGSSLCQGDIISAVPYPLLSIRDLSVDALGNSGVGVSALPDRLEIRPVSHRIDPAWGFTAHIATRLCLCAVISNCCELELRDGRFIPPSFSLARLKEVPPQILRDPAKSERLRANTNPLTGTSYIDYFYLESHPKLDNKEWMVDCSLVCSLTKESYSDALKSKILQLDDRTRGKFKIKLAAYLARFNPEETAAGVDKPWNG